MIRRTKKPQALVAIRLEERSVSAMTVDWCDGKPMVSASGTFPMKLNLLKDESDLVASELSTHLNTHGVHGRRCLFCVPVRWLLSAQLAIPDIPEEDIAGYIELQAESQFPMQHDELAIVASRYGNGSGRGGATLLAMPQANLNRLRTIARLARLNVIGVTTGITALANRFHTTHAAALHLRPPALEFALYSDGGLATIRAFDLGEKASATGELQHLGRDLKISMNRLSPAVRAAVASIDVYGDSVATTALVEYLHESLPGLETNVHPRTLSSNGKPLDGNEDLFYAAASQLSDSQVHPNFLPPEPSRLERLLQTALKKRATSLLGAGVAVALLLISLFGVQGYQLARLESDRSAIANDADMARALQEQIRQFRDWFSAGAPTLDAVMLLTGVFPEEGTVWLRSLSVKEGATIQCTGKAADGRAWLAMLEELRATPGVDGVQVSQIRGEAPLEFSFSFLWKKGTS